MPDLQTSTPSYFVASSIEVFDLSHLVISRSLFRTRQVVRMPKSDLLKRSMLSWKHEPRIPDDRAVRPLCCTTPQGLQLSPVLCKEWVALVQDRNAWQVQHDFHGTTGHWKAAS